jgi:hypothetical protein
VNATFLVELFSRVGLAKTPTNGNFPGRRGSREDDANTLALSIKNEFVDVWFHGKIVLLLKF